MAILFSERSEQIDRAGYEAYHNYLQAHNNDNPDHSESFRMGAEWADNHPLQSCNWVDAQKYPAEDGKYLTLIASSEGVSVEFAPWQDGAYQGQRAMLVNLGIERVTHWAILNLPKDLLEIISSLKQ